MLVKHCFGRIVATCYTQHAVLTAVAACSECHHSRSHPYHDCPWCHRCRATACLPWRISSSLIHPCHQRKSHSSRCLPGIPSFLQEPRDLCIVLSMQRRSLTSISRALADGVIVALSLCPCQRLHQEYIKASTSSFKLKRKMQPSYAHLGHALPDPC